MGIKYTRDVAVWETPIGFLTTLITFSRLYKFKIENVSWSILIVLPTETFAGILDTYISVTIPVEAYAGIFSSNDEI